MRDRTGRNNPYFNDKTGKQFGLLRVIKLVPSKTPGAHWECQCICGKVVILDSTVLRKGGTKSCGCLSHKRGREHPNFRDLTGRRFGKFLVIGLDNNRHRVRERLLWKCQCDCGQVKNVLGENLRSGQSTSCDCNRGGGAKSPKWKGGTYISKGYRMIYTPDPSIFRVGTNKLHAHLPEHIVVMSKHLHRPLLKEETVHHKNGNKLDNDIRNLELWSSNHPHGQRVEDLIKWASELLILYTGRN